MGRWPPDAQDRLIDAAIDLFVAKGFLEVTVDDIAAAAGVTPRTFFRYFPTKEEVLFANGGRILDLMVSTVQNATEPFTAVELLSVALFELATALEPDRAEQRKRSAVIRSAPSLLERELLKQHRIAQQLAGELVARGVSQIEATTLAGVGMVAFQTAYREWTTDRKRITLHTRIEQTLAVIGNALSVKAG